MVGMTPMRRVPASGSPTRCAISTRSSASTSRRRARSTSCTPAAVGSTRRRSRSNSLTLRTPSSWASWALSDGCDTWQRAAARWKLSVSATATAYCSWRRVNGCGARFMIGRAYQTYKDNVLEQSGADRHSFPNPSRSTRRKERRQPMLTVGDKLPAFRLTSVVGLEKNKEFQEVGHDTYPGKWVVLFLWPMDFTFICPTEIAEFGKRNQDFSDRDAQLLGASTDTHFVHLAWRKDHPDLRSLPYPMLADTKRELVSALGVAHKQDGVALRATFVVDPQGIIRHVSVNDLSVGRNVDEVLRVLDALQTDELCPCNWKKGDPTLEAA